jgi:RHS repeat-associated protein
VNSSYSAAALATYSYTAFGIPLGPGGSIANPFQFGGQVGYQQMTALTSVPSAPNLAANQVLAGVRAIDSFLARFMSVDPIWLNGGDSNLYRYVGNMPTRYTDPSGLGCSCCPSNPYQCGALGNGICQKFDCHGNCCCEYDDTTQDCYGTCCQGVSGCPQKPICMKKVLDICVCWKTFDPLGKADCTGDCNGVSGCPSDDFCVNKIDGVCVCWQFWNGFTQKNDCVGNCVGVKSCPGNPSSGHGCTTSQWTQCYDQCRGTVQGGWYDPYGRPTTCQVNRPGYPPGHLYCGCTDDFTPPGSPVGGM